MSRSPQRGLNAASGTACDVSPAAGSAPAAGDSETLRVVVVSTERGWHGGEEQASLLVRGLRSRGHRCFVLARHRGTFARRMADEGFPVSTFAGNGRSPSAIFRIRQHLGRIKPQVVHANDGHALTSAGLASLGLRVPARIASRRVDFPIRSAVRFRCLCDRIICISHAVARVCGQGTITRERIAVVHSGVDPQRVASGDRVRGRGSLGLREDQPLLLTVATLTDHKGHRFLLEAMGDVLKHRSQVCLALAGDGDLTASLKKQAGRLGIGDRVRFLGYRDDVPDLLMAADLFVLPSHMEGLCTSLIDAMLAERPIVTTTAGGIPEVVGGVEPAEEPSAWLVPPRDPARLAAAILEALDSPELCAARKQRARHRARRLFTADRMVEETLAVYRDVLRQKAAAPKAV